jgi:hypothetical protein
MKSCAIVTPKKNQINNNKERQSHLSKTIIGSVIRGTINLSTSWWLAQWKLIKNCASHCAVTAHVTLVMPSTAVAPNPSARVHEMPLFATIAPAI